MQGHSGTSQGPLVYHPALPNTVIISWLHVATSISIKIKSPAPPWHCLQRWQLSLPRHHGCPWTPHETQDCQEEGQEFIQHQSD